MRFLIIGLLLVANSFAQLSPSQKQQDFLNLAGLFNKQYGPYEWKKQLFGFDALDVRPWLARVIASKDDPEFLDICQEYTASFRDGHVFFSIPANFSAQVPISVDIYDGRVLVEAISRVTFPLATAPILRGDEIVSLDGKPVVEIMQSLERYAGSLANPRAARRSAADFLFSRPQSRIPQAILVGDSVEIGVRHRGSDDVTTYMTPWVKSGEPIRTLGLIPTLNGSRVARLLSGAGQPKSIPTEGPSWKRILWEHGYSAADHEPADLDPTIEVFHGVTGRSATLPVFTLPTGFVRRIGQTNADNFLTGTYTSGGKRIGYIRIPRMTPNNFNFALAQFETEITFLEANTDGLVVDVMRNPGGIIEYGHSLAEYFVSSRQDAVGFQLRATLSRITNLSSQLTAFRNQNAPAWVIQLFQKTLDDVKTAYSENRGLTGTLPLDRPYLDIYPATDVNFRPVVYTRPMIILMDEFSVSTADLFPAVLQDAGRAKLVGYRSGGLGGTNGSFYSGVYSETTTGVTFGLMVRPKAINAEGFPSTQYIENVGVRPDIELDYMTTANLLQNGVPFVAEFTRIILDEINNPPQ